jgi:hypothetical protein
MRELNISLFAFLFSCLFWSAANKTGGKKTKNITTFDTITYLIFWRAHERFGI